MKAFPRGSRVENVSLAGFNQAGDKPVFAQWHGHKGLGRRPPPTNYLMGNPSSATSPRSGPGPVTTLLRSLLGPSVDAGPSVCWRVPLDPGTGELGASGPCWLNSPPLRSGCFSSLRRRCLSPASEDGNGPWPPWQRDFAFLADILSRPLGVGCYSISQRARGNSTEMLQAVCGKGEGLAPEPEPLARTVRDRGEQRRWPGGGLWASPWRSGRRSVPVSAWRAP